MTEEGTTPSYEGTLQHHGLSEDDMREECSDEFVLWLAKKMIRWQRVDLGLDRGVVAGIKSDSSDEEGRRHQLLERWKEKFGHEATYGKLVRSFMQSEMANMADTVCKWRKKTLGSGGGCAEKIHLVPGVATQQFASQAGPSSEERHSQIDSPPVFVDTIGTSNTTGQEKKDVTTSSNKPEQGHREDMSDFVTGKPSATNGSTPLATNGSTNSKLVNILDRVTLMFCKSDAELEKKKGKFNELKGRKEEVESYLSEKEKEIERLESETHDASIKLTLSGDVKWRRKSWLNSSRR